jgi:hypothetical protein
LLHRDFLRKTGLREPFVVEVNEPELDMKMPDKDITVYDIADMIGHDHPLEVIGKCTRIKRWKATLTH